jgi:hypothetical protein
MVARLAKSPATFFVVLFGRYGIISYFCRREIVKNMTTTISIPTSEYNRAKVYAKERNLSIDELFIVLLGQLTSRDEDAAWESMSADQPYTHEELMARINEGEAQFERGEYKTHEQMMAELRKEFSWLR